MIGDEIRDLLQGGVFIGYGVGVYRKGLRSRACE